MLSELTPAVILRWCIFNILRINRAKSELVPWSSNSFEQSLEARILLICGGACSLASLKNSQNSKMCSSLSMWTSGYGK